MANTIKSTTRYDRDAAERAGLSADAAHYEVLVNLDNEGEAEFTVTLYRGKVYAVERVFGPEDLDHDDATQVLVEQAARAAWNRGE